MGPGPKAGPESQDLNPGLWAKGLGPDPNPALWSRGRIESLINEPISCVLVVCCWTVLLWSSSMFQFICCLQGLHLACFKVKMCHSKVPMGCVVTPLALLAPTHMPHFVINTMLDSSSRELSPIAISYEHGVTHLIHSLYSFKVNVIC